MHSDMIDPRTDLPQASIPQGGGYTNFDALRGCVVHWFSDCVLVSGGSQRTDAIRPSSNAPGPLSQSRGTTTASSSGTTSAVPPQDPSFSFVLVVSDSCVYVFDKSAVVIRCIPIASIARLIVLDLVARDARSSDTIRQHAARGAARESGIDQESAHELLQQAAHQLLGSSNSKAAAAMSRSGVVPCFSLLGIAVASDQSTSKEHDLLVGVPLGATEELCGILLRIHWAHLGPNTKLAVEAVDLTPVRRHKQPRGGTSGRGEELLVVPTIGDVFHGIDDAAVPPLLGLDTTRSPHWELHVEPLRRWSQLEDLLSKKHAMLVDEEVAIESAFRRIKSSLTEHSSFEQRDRWRQMAQQNRKLTDAVKALEAEVVISRRLLEQEVPGGLELLKKLIAGGGALQAPGLSAIDSISGNALFNVDTTMGGGGGGDPSSTFFLSPIATPSQMHINTLASIRSSASFSRGAGGGGHSSSTASLGGAQKCTRCRELEFLVESHPNVDKVRILKAEEALITLQRKLAEADTHVQPLRLENVEMRSVISKMMRELVHASETESKMRRKQSTVVVGDDDAARALHSKSFEVGVRNAIRTGEPYYRIDSLEDGGQPSASATLGDEVRQWRLLCSEMERRHREELKDLYNAFTMYDEIMSQAVHEALKHYEPTANVNLAQATSNIIVVAKTRAKEAKAAGSRAKQGGGFSAMAAANDTTTSTTQMQQHGIEEHTRHLHSNSDDSSRWNPAAMMKSNAPQSQQHHFSNHNQWNNNNELTQQSRAAADGGWAYQQREQQAAMKHGTAVVWPPQQFTPGPLDSMVRWAEI